MHWFQKLRLRCRALFKKEKLDARMDDEMRSHIEMQTQENIDAGMNPEEARYAALGQFGWVESIKDTCREQRGVSWIENLGQDLRYGARMLRKNPGFTAVIDDRLGRDVAGIVDVAARIAGESHLLAPVSQASQVPARAREGTLCVLAFDAEDREAVCLHFQRSAEHRRVKPEPCVASGQSN